MKKILTFLIILFSLNSSADYTVGVSAYNNGDTRTAIIEWLTDMKDGEYISAGFSAYYIGKVKQEEENYIDAIKFYEVAAQRGIDFAQFALGRSYYAYPEVRNLIYAYMWMEIAMSNGHETTDGKNYAESHLNFEELAIASRLSIRCALSKFVDCTLKPEEEKRIADAKKVEAKRIADVKNAEAKKIKNFKPLNMKCLYELSTGIQDIRWTFDGKNHSGYWESLGVSLTIKKDTKLSGKDKFNIMTNTGQSFENDYNNYKSVSTFAARKYFGVCYPV